MGLQEIFNTLVTCAVLGLRCPIKGQLGVTSVAIGELALSGWIKVFISGRNWRTVIILQGPHKGKSTLPNPQGHKIGWVSDHNGFRRALFKDLAAEGVNCGEKIESACVSN